jgi:FkbM family methyltransferase
MLHKGDWSEEEFSYGRLHFGMFGEDCVLLSLFAGRKAGFYIDVGAFHPICYSNTHQLSKLGWTGINIEPNPESFRLFPRLRPRDINLNLAVSRESGHLDFVCDGMYSGFCDEEYAEFRGNFLKDSAGANEKPMVRVEVRPLSQVVAEHVPQGRVVDLISVDCEGADLAVLQSADWAVFRPRVVLVEDHSNSPDGEIEAFMREQGYVHYCRIGLTRFFLEPEFGKSLGLKAAANN